VSHLSHLASKARHRYNDIMGLERYAQLIKLHRNFLKIKLDGIIP